MKLNRFLSQKVKQLPQYILYVLWLIVWFAGSLFAYVLGWALGFVIYALLRKRRKVIRVNLQLMQPQLNSYQIILWGLSSVCCLIQNLMMTPLYILASYLPLEYLKPILSVSGEQYLENNQRPIIFVGVHSASVFVTSLTPVFVIKKKKKINVLYRPAENKLAEALLGIARARSGQFWSRKKTGVFRYLLSALRRGECLSFCPDIKITSHECVFVPFFGITTSTSPSLFRIADLSGADMVPYSIFSTGIGKYSIIFDEPLKNFSCNDLVAAAKYMNESLERQIMRAPKQYIWLHKRLGNPPKNTPNPYNI